MKVVVVGAHGEMGARVTQILQARGHRVVPASRSSGVDAQRGRGLPAALDGAHCLVDCLNVTTVRRRRAEQFFLTTARRLTEAALTAGVGHAVVVGIVNAIEPEVRGALGYYAGKAVQEETYVASPVPVRVVASTAWFSLARQFLTQGRLGPFALVPAMTLQPVHPDAVAVALADAVEAGPGREKRQLVGPERLRADAMARDLATATGRRVPVVGVPYPGRAFRDHGLLPTGRFTQDERRYADWLRSSAGGPGELR